jgi:RNA polymerase sigma-70 factor, ECF subfamily
MHEREDVRSSVAALVPRLRRFGRALTGSASDADELVQDACERALLRSGQLNSAARLDGWMYAIMRNLWVDEARQRRLRPHDGIEAAMDVVGDDGRGLAEARSTLAAVRHALAKLPSEQRTILVLVCVDGMSYREAGEVLGIPLGTVMSRLARARRALHERLAQPALADRGALVSIGSRWPRHEPGKAT